MAVGSITIYGLGLNVDIYAWVKFPYLDDFQLVGNIGQAQMGEEVTLSGGCSTGTIVKLSSSNSSIIDITTHKIINVVPDYEGSTWSITNDTTVECTLQTSSPTAYITLTVVPAVSNITLDLSTIGLPAGSHSIQIKLSDDGLTKRDSELSNAVLFTKQPIGYNVTIGVSGSPNQSTGSASYSFDNGNTWTDIEPTWNDPHIVNLYNVTQIKLQARGADRGYVRIPSLGIEVSGNPAISDNIILTSNIDDISLSGNF